MSRSTTSTIGLLVLFLLAVWLAQAQLNPFYLQVLGLLGINIIATVSLNFAAGFGGMFSLGHPAFMALGGYTAAILTYPVAMKATRIPGYPDWMLQIQLPFLPALLIGGVVASLVAILVGWPVLRLRGHYLAVATLGLTVIVQVAIVNLRDYTRGALGLSGIPGLTNLWWIAGFVVVTVYVVVRLVHSRFGRALRAVRDDYLAAQMSGVNVARTRLIGFSIAAFFAGIAGGLLGHLLRILTPGQFSFNAVFLGVAMMILGGMGSTTGAILGATIMTLLPQFIIPLERGGDFLGVEIPALNGLTQIVTALILIGVMLVKPAGLAGAKEFSWQTLFGRPRAGKGGGSVPGGAGAGG
ncbi:MAG TPA: branched-chain amino acid ABC transporter permease [Verrucomicrobiae bacterium]|jgi:branched-chain amino acid transport system permease protein|nr:branched-chain amino acid ABC transporter permease [Verrucomicrobiae bacterium]